jgi:hypothetical protein
VTLMPLFWALGVLAVLAVGALCGAAVAQSGTVVAQEPPLLELAPEMWAEAR